MDVTYQVDEMEAASDAAAAPHTRTNRRVFVSAGEFYQAVGTTQLKSFFGSKKSKLNSRIDSTNRAEGRQFELIAKVNVNKCHTINHRDQYRKANA